MKFKAQNIAGVFEIQSQTHVDERGSFTRLYCESEFNDVGLELPNSQHAISRNSAKGTLRGLHFIPEEVGEAKLVRCINGVVFDVVVDLRDGSETFGDFAIFELSAKAANAVFIPRGVAHGFITLKDDSDILYQFSQPHRADIEQGVRWDDPQINVPWPMAPAILSKRDQELPFLKELS